LWFYQVITTTLPFFLAPRKPEWRNNNKILSKNFGEIFSDWQYQQSQQEFGLLACQKVNALFRILFF
jgi:hypothetical protein